MSRTDPGYFLEKAEYFYNLAKNLAEDDVVDETEDVTEETTEAEPEPTPAVPEVKHYIKPAYRRYFDPVTRHFYRSDQIFDTDNVPVVTKPDVWYPESQPNKPVFSDGNNHYRIKKTYDPSGKYAYQVDKLAYKPLKKPGSNFYRANYVTNL